MLRLVPTGPFRTETFVTLSHCWGHNVQPILTTQNIEERCESGIPIDALPKTFQDAITVTEWFDVKWLWIDCLCIIQDSKEDWLREAKMMAPNYRQALFDISADAIEAGTSGLFQPRRAVDYLPLSFTATALDRTTRFTPCSVNQFAWIHDAPTFSRAWVHRERQLSRRILHFTDQQMIWECCATTGHGFASDMVPGEPLTSRPFGADNKQHVHGLQLAGSGGIGRDESELHDSWDDVCHNISQKRLTVLTDMPIVLSTLAEDFAALLHNGDQYLAGLWRWTMPRNLLWKTDHHRRLRQSPYIAPTWSWMSTACSTTFDARKLGRSDIVHDVAEFQSADLQYKNGNDAFGPLFRGVLTLRGYLRSLQFTFDLPSAGKQIDPCSLSVFDNDRWRTVGPRWDKRTGDLFELKLDKAHSRRQFDCSCIFISTKFWGSFESCWQEISALLLTRNEQDEWQRIGIITFKDFYSLQVSPEFRSRLWLVKHKQLKKHQNTFWEQHKAAKDNERADDELGEKSEPEVWVQEPDPADLYAFDSGLDTRYLNALEPQTIVLT
ncbi:hypothetical protein LTR78_002883 [Recurvomyces mirabilis]|uniref:Heterokaryon incompatibility domain-containing protein n=1 Tax=Recurvomyces mirabilis TaxID=574656 RepID=A0AAE0WT93_9PEZI|nr:hypothetical protein LTR78_002883 [Recurvomyces mirabilis]KAK5159383.1 hypothetical protein LTS14_002525 [Recurvomyces mirabilis]